MNVLITGANRGIGLALTRAFRARGDDVIAAVRASSPALDETGARVLDGIDITDDDAVGRLAQALGEERLDVLLLNAGLLVADALEGADLGDVRAQLEVNAVAPLRVTKAVLGHLAEGAKVAILTSRMGSMRDNTSGGYYGYRMSKAAVNAFGVSLAHDLKSRRVSVVLLHPGYVRTGMTRGHGELDPDEAARGLIARIDETTLQNTGRFVHMNGEALPF